MIANTEANTEANTDSWRGGIRRRFRFGRPTVAARRTTVGMPPHRTAPQQGGGRSRTSGATSGGGIGSSKVTINNSKKEVQDVAASRSGISGNPASFVGHYISATVGNDYFLSGIPGNPASFVGGSPFPSRRTEGPTEEEQQQCPA